MTFLITWLQGSISNTCSIFGLSQRERTFTHLADKVKVKAKAMWLTPQCKNYPVNMCYLLSENLCALRILASWCCWNCWFLSQRGVTTNDLNTGLGGELNETHGFFRVSIRSWLQVQLLQLAVVSMMVLWHPLGSLDTLSSQGLV